MTRRQVLAAVRLGPATEERLAATMLRRKVWVYRDTLRELAARYGDDRGGLRADGSPRPQISTAIRNALEAEAKDHAAKVTRTYNRLVRNEARRRTKLSPEELARHLVGYMDERADVRAPLIARNEEATARLDALVNFAQANGVEPAFDFTGPKPKCPTCVVLKASGPHPLERVLAIGRPHIGCPHLWKPRLPARSKLPAKLRLGRGGPAGLVGADPIVTREGGQIEAVRQIIEEIAPRPS